jgi:hypothetical protein
MFFPEKVVPRIIMNKKSLCMLDVKRITPCAKVLSIIVIIKMGLLPYVSEYGGRMKKPMNMPTM